MRRLLAVMVMLGLLLGAAACGGSDEGGSGGSAAGSTAADGGGSGDVKMALVVKTLSQPVWRDVAAGVREEAAKRGIEMSVEGGKSEEDIQGQINTIEDLLVKGVRALLVAPNGTGQLGPVLERAVAQGVPVVLIDTDIPDFDEKTTLVATDNYGTAKDLSERFVRALGGTAIAGILDYPNVSSVAERVRGTMDAIRGTNIRVVSTLAGDCDQTKALNSTTDMLQAHPEITAIFGECGNNATGAIQAIENAGKVPGKDIKVIGFDGTALELDAIAAGKELLSVSQDFPGIGARAVGAAVDALADRSVPKTIYVPARLITKDTVEQFK